MLNNSLPMHETIPDKSFFKALEISSLLSIKPHILRYWESEFGEIRAQKTKDGQRLYRREDVLIISTIKHLLHDKKFTIAGARKVLRDMQNGIPVPKEIEIIEENVAQCSEPEEQFLEQAAEHLFVGEQSFSIIEQEIYENCSEVAKDEQISNDEIEVYEKDLKESSNKTIDYEKALATLIASKQSLTEVLKALA